MGIEIDRSSFGEADYRAFGLLLEENLECLQQLLSQPGFGDGPASLGSELELYVVDTAGNPLYANEDILADSGDPHLTLELNRYNLEFNLSAYALSDSAFASTEREILTRLGQLRAVAARHGGRIVPIGILPTRITPRRRYQALVDQLISRRGDEFRIDINGDDPLMFELADITLEGANTSFQVHYRVRPADYADTFNAVQLVTPLVLAW